MGPLWYWVGGAGPVLRLHIVKYSGYAEVNNVHVDVHSVSLGRLEASLKLGKRRYRPVEVLRGTKAVWV